MQKRVVLTSVLSGPGPSTSTHGGKENGVQSSSSSVHKNRPTSSSTSPPVTSSGKKSSKASNETSNNKTIRIQIKLQPPTNDSFPEFFYDELMKKADKNNNNKSTGPRDPFEEDDEDEMKRLARSFEEKYGGGSSSGKNKKPIGGRRSEWEDYVDKGMGYDETDPFIDNDEAYDELIPHELTTKYGGFYVNTGQLEFKVVSNSDQEESQDNNKRLPAAVVAANMNQAAKRRKSVDSSKELKKKKKKSLEAASILSPVSSSQVKSSAKDDQSDNIIAVKKKKTPIIVSDDEEETPKTGSPCDKNVDDVIESVVRGAKHDSRTNEENPGRPKVFDITTTPTINNNHNNNNNNNPNSIPRTKSHTPPSSQVLPESRVEGLAMSSLARMANIARNEQKPSSQQQQQQQQPNRVHAPSKTGSSRHPRAVITDPGPSTASTDHQNLNHNKISNQPTSSPQAQLFNRKHDVSQLLMPQPSSSTQRTSSKNKPHPSSSQQLMSSQGNPKQQPISGYFHKQTSPQSIVEKVISDGLQMYPSASSSSPNHSRPSLDSKSSQHRSPSSFLQPPAAHSSSTGQSSHHPYVSFMETVNSSSNKTGSHRVLNLPPKTSSSPQEGLSSRTLTPSPSQGQQGQQQQQHQQLQRCNSSGSKDRRVDNNNRPPSSHVRGGPPAGNSSHVSDSSFTPHFPSVIQSPTHAGWPSLDLYGGLHNSLLFRNTSPTSPANPLVSMGAGSAHHHANVMARHFLNQLHSQSPSTSSTSDLKR